MDVWTPQWVSGSPQAKLVIYDSNPTEAGTATKLKWTLYYVASSAAVSSVNKTWKVDIDGVIVKSGTFSINGKTGTHTIASGETLVARKKTSRSFYVGVIFEFNLTWRGVYGGERQMYGAITIPSISNTKITYNANGGSGAPSAQTKWYGEILTLSSVKPSRTGHTFTGWKRDSTSEIYQPGSKYGIDGNVTMHAQWKAHTYTVSYNANGGTGAPGAQTKTYGQTLTLHSTKPTRTNYNFVGWGTSASSTSASYQPGGSYTNNSGVTLYAIWKLAYKAPRITNYRVDRCNSSGSLDDNGQYVRVRFSWACDRTVSSIKLERKISTSSSYEGTVTVSASGTSGSVDTVVGANNYSLEYAYDVRVTVTDSGGSTNQTSTVQPLKFIIDFRSGGKGVAIGKPSTLYNHFELALPFKQMSSRYVHKADATVTSSTNYIKFLRFKILKTWINQPFKITVTQRGRKTTCDIYILFKPTDNLDPGIAHFHKDGDDRYLIYIAKADTSTWELYIKKSEAYENFAVLDFQMEPIMMNMHVQWINENADALPSGYIEARTIPITKTGYSCTWEYGRDNASLRLNHNFKSNAYTPILSNKTYNGSWELGTFNNDNLYFTYIKDSTYGSGRNTVSQQYILPSSNSRFTGCELGGKLVTVSGWDEAWAYNNGLMVIRIVRTVNATFGQWGSMYSYDVAGISIPAGTFINTPSFFVGARGSSVRDANAIYAINSAGSATKSPSIVIVRPTVSNGNITYSVLAIGRWK